MKVNSPSSSNNIGKYHLLHIWDEVLFNTPECKISQPFENSGHSICHTLKQHLLNINQQHVATTYATVVIPSVTLGHNICQNTTNMWLLWLLLNIVNECGCSICDTIQCSVKCHIHTAMSLSQGSELLNKIRTSVENQVLL